MTHACTSASRDIGASHGSMTSSTAAVRTNGTTCASVVAVHAVAYWRSRRSSMRGRQATAPTSGSGSAVNLR
jgi:hypothetical protein